MRKPRNRWDFLKEAFLATFVTGIPIAVLYRLGVIKDPVEGEIVTAVLTIVFWSREILLQTRNVLRLIWSKAGLPPRSTIIIISKRIASGAVMIAVGFTITYASLQIQITPAYPDDPGQLLPLFPALIGFVIFSAGFSILLGIPFQTEMRNKSERDDPNR